MSGAKDMRPDTRVRGQRLRPLPEVVRHEELIGKLDAIIALLRSAQAEKENGQCNFYYIIDRPSGIPLHMNCTLPHGHTGLHLDAAGGSWGDAKPYSFSSL